MFLSSATIEFPRKKVVQLLCSKTNCFPGIIKFE